MMPPSSISYSLAGGACFALAGAIFDLRRRRIPDRLTASAILIALTSNAWMGGLRGFLGSLAACVLAGAVFALMFFMGGMGGGDVKLMAAIAAFAGLGHLVQLLIMTALAGGVFALVLALARGALGHTLRHLFACLWPWRTPRPESAGGSRLYLPYAVAIAAGALLTLYSGVIAS